jgi:hypothetical protein
MIIAWLGFIAVGLLTYAAFLELARLLRYSVSWKISFLLAGVKRRIQPADENARSHLHYVFDKTNSFGLSSSKDLQT